MLHHEPLRTSGQFLQGLNCAWLFWGETLESMKITEASNWVVPTIKEMVVVMVVMVAVSTAVVIYRLSGPH